MAIENFTQAEFEQALPAPGGVPLWKCNGYDGRTKQLTYTVTPFATLPNFGILVFSSIKQAGASTAKAGGDSIRAVITLHNKPYGGKPVRWIDRRPGWKDRLTEYLRALANQIKWLALPCPSCGSTLVPFTARNGKVENKGRAYVCCRSENCGHPAWEWTETEDGERIAPPSTLKRQQGQTNAAAAPVIDAAAPKCPLCESGMTRMPSNKGYRCSKGSVKKVDGEWETIGCAGVVWDNDRSKTPQVNQPTPAPVNGEKPYALPDAIVGKIRAAVAHLDDDDIEAAVTLLRSLYQ